MPPIPQVPEFILSDDLAGPIYVKDVYNKSSVMKGVHCVIYGCI